MSKEIEYMDLEESMSTEHFSLAIQGLIARGLMEKVTIDGQVKYRLTELGKIVGSHIHADVKGQS